MAKKKGATIIITASSLACFFKCPRQYYMSYIVGWRKRKPSDALRFGTAFHKGIEEILNGTELGGAMIKAIETAKDGQEFDAEVAMQLKALLTGYYLKWGRVIDGAKSIETEREFEVRFPFLRGCVICGKVDGVFTTARGGTGIIEHKTTSEDISPLSDYWEGINRDQVALYKAAMERKGKVIDVVVYDVIRKPTIHIGKGETAEDYCKRLMNDCVGEQVGDNPRAKDYKRGSGFYFGRKSVPLLSNDMDELARRLYVFSKLSATMKRLAKRFVDEGASEISAYPKCGSVMTCKGCAFRGVCGQSELPSEEWERGRMFEELEIAKKYL